MGAMSLLFRTLVLKTAEAARTSGAGAREAVLPPELQRWAVLLDSRFRVPGTRIRFGVDALLGLVPGIGDLAAPAFTALLLVQALRLRVPLVVQMRMVLNAAADMLIGLVPLVGDAGDVLWKANLKNVALLERHARPGLPPRRSDYVFVGVWLAVLGVVAVVPLLVLIWLLATVPLI